MKLVLIFVSLLIFFQVGCEKYSIIVRNYTNIYNKIRNNSTNYSETELQIILRNKTHFCPNDCSNNGFCLDGKCFCVPEFFGEDCSKSNKQCINNCSEKGECVYGKCKCQENYGGVDCSVSNFTLND
jgi:hypothetical protein